MPVARIEPFKRTLFFFLIFFLNPVKAPIDRSNSCCVVELVLPTEVHTLRLEVMARTRAAKGNEKAAGTDSSTATPTAPDCKYTLSTPSQNPPKVFILPTKATKDARIVSLLHPRYARPTRYLVCPETGFYEFTRISAPKSTPRSWLIQTNGDDGESDKKDAAPEPAHEDTSFGTYVTNGAELFVATPLDPLFLILPTLIDPASKSEKRRYISGDDHFDRIQDQSPHLWEILRWGEGRVRNLLEARLGAACDIAEAGDERMYRLNEDKLVAEIVSKARRMSSRSLPQSMEEKFVSRPLEAPVLGVKREPIITATSSINAPAESQDGTQTSESTSVKSTPKIDAAESQSSISMDSSASLPSDASTAATSVSTREETAESEEKLKSQSMSEPQLLPAMIASPEVTSLQRLRTAFNFLCSAYIPRQLVEMLQTRLASQPGVDFAPLDAYLSELNRLKQEAAAAWSAGDYGCKRALDDEEIAERAEKKRKKEEEEKRKKAGESRGVRNLKKVDTTGMKKMSHFFKKKA